MAAEPTIDAAVVHVVPMRRRHLKSVLEIERQVYPHPWTKGLFLGELAILHSRAYVVARVGRTVVGYAGLMMSLDDGHITTVAVDPAWQRHRIATRLVLVLAREALQRGARALTLEVRLSNTGAQALYRRFGFVPVGVRKGYYQPDREDAIVMWVHDAHHEEYLDLLDRIEAQLPSPTVRSKR